MAAIAPRFVRASWVGGIALVVGLAGTAAWTLSTARLYRSEAILMFERGVQAGPPGLGDSPRGIATRLQDMLMSRQRLETLIKDMKLYQGLLDKRGVVDAIEEMRKRIVISNRDGFTFRISYDGESRDLAKDVLTQLTTSLVGEDRKRRTQDAEEARRFLDAERKQSDEDLKEREKLLASFLTKHPQLAAEAGGGATAGGLIRAADRDRTGAAGGEVAALELQAAQLEESLAAAGAPRTVGGHVVAVVDPQLTAAYTRAQSELQAAQRDLAEKQMHLTNEHPDMKQSVRRVASAEVAERRAAAALQAWKPSAVTETPVAAAENPGTQGRIAALRHALSAVRQQIASVKGRSVPRGETPHAPDMAVAVDNTWTRLNRDVAEARERQAQLESRQFQAQLAAALTAGGQGGQFVIADPPFRPMRPIAGSRLKIALVGGAASVALALLVIFIAAAFDDRLYAAHDVEGVIDDGVVVVIPKVIPRLAAPVHATAERAKES